MWFMRYRREIRTLTPLSPLRPDCNLYGPGVNPITQRDWLTGSVTYPWGANQIKLDFTGDALIGVILF